MIGIVKYIKKIIVPVLSLSVLLTACGQKSSQQEPSPKQQSMQSEQSATKVPDQLKNIEDSIEKVIKTLDGPAVEVKEDKDKKGTQATQNKGSSQQQQSKDQSKDSEQGKDQGQGKDSNKEEGKSKEGGAQQGNMTQQGATQPQDPWAKITPIVNNLHYQWNSYLPMGAKAGASRTLIDNFSTALNSLTNTIIGKNKTNTLLAASYLYAYIPDFYSLYRTKTSPEIKRIRYYTRNAILNAMTANWAQADSDINNLKASWAILKSTGEKEQQDSMSKLDFSIYELDKVIKDKNQPLSDIKGRVTLSNIEALEKSMDKQQGKGSQGGQEGQGGQTSSGQEGTQSSEGGNDHSSSEGQQSPDGQS